MRAAITQTLTTYRVPLLLTAGATVLSLLLLPLGPRAPFAIFIAAVLVGAWAGGWRAAVATTLLSTVALALLCWFKTSTETLEDHLLRLGVFVLVGLLGGYLSQQCRRAIRAVDEVHDILAGSGLALVAVDAEGHVTSLNPLARTLAGLGPDDGLGAPLDEVVHLVDGQTRRPLVLPLADVLAGSHPHSLPEGALLLAVAGGETAVEGTASPVRNDEGRATGVVLTFRSTGEAAQARQELRQRADRFRALAGYAPTPLLVLDATGRCVYTNPAGQAICDCSSEECLGEGWSRHVVARDRDRVLSQWPAALRARQPFSEELRLQPPNGELRWVRLRAAPMLSDNSELLGQVATLEDISERKQIEEQVREEHRRAEEAFAASERRLEEVRSEGERRLHETLRQAQEEHQERLRQVEEGSHNTAATLEKQSHELATVRHERHQMEEALRQTRQEHESRRKQAEDEARDKSAALHKQVQELQQALEQTRRELAHRSEEDAVAGKLAEEEIARARAVFDKDLKEALTGQQHLEDELRKVRLALEEARRVAAEREAELHRRHEEQGSIVAGTEELRRSLDEQRRLCAAREEELRRCHDERETERASWRQETAKWKEGEAALRAEGERHRTAASEALRERNEQAHRAEEELRRAKEFLEGVIESSPEGIFAHDREGRCLVWNAALERLLDRPRSEALQRTAAELFPPANGESGERFSLLRHDGPHARIASAHAQVRTQSGEVIGGMVVVRPVPRAAPEASERNGRPPMSPRTQGAAEALDWLAFN